MKINRMWAMFDKKGVFSPYMIAPTRKEVIDKAQRHSGIKWRHNYQRYGHRIEKVVVLRADEVEAEINAAREEMLELAELKLRYPVTVPTEKRWKIFIEAYQERFGEQG